MTTYYDILGVATDAEPEVIKAAYRAMSKKYHPDTSGATNAEDRAKQLNEAYATLEDDDRRLAYDASLRSGSGDDEEYDADDFSDRDCESGSVATTGPIEDQKPNSVLWDTFYLIFIVPFAFLLSLFFAFILFFTVISVFFDWLIADNFGWSEFFASIKDALAFQYKAFTNKEPVDQTQSVSVLVLILNALWFYIVGGAASGSVIEQTREGHPRLPLSLVGSVLVATTCGFAYWGLRSYGSMSTGYMLNTVVQFGAIMAGTLVSLRQARRQS